MNLFRPSSSSRRPLIGSAFAIALSCAWLVPTAVEARAAPRVITYPSWPLGPDGSIARQLFSSHFQYWQWTYVGATVELVHQGVDIGGCAREPVYAVEDGTVVFSNFRDSKADGQYKELIVSRGVDDTRGIRYLHLGGAAVAVGDKVVKDQLIGTIVNWLQPCSFDHLHVQVVKPNDPNWTSGNPWPNKSTTDVVNPLTVFDPTADKLQPSCSSVSSTYNSSSSVDVLFYASGGGAELDPDALQGTIDVVASLRDECFDIAAACAASAGGCSEVISTHVAPYRLNLAIYKTDAGGVEGLIDPTASIEFKDGITSSAAELIARYYHKNTVGNCSERDLRFNLTKGGGVTWTPADGDYKVHVSAEDLAGNVYLVPPKQITVKNPP